MYLLHLDKNHDYLISKLDEVGFKNDIDLISNKTEIEKKIHKYCGLIIRSRIPIDNTFIKKATNLKFIARVGSGLENIDIQCCRSLLPFCYRSIQCHSAFSSLVQPITYRCRSKAF